jgi:hypothetical protein
VRAPWKARVAIATTLVVVLAGVVAGGIVVWGHLRTKKSVVPGCQVTVGTAKFVMDIDQASNATTITTVAKQLGMPDHAVTIALAAALQESQLHNVAYGDRDSLGLFQQRPSQGWGTRAQILDPHYASTRFFQALAHVPGWETMSVTSAAQAVQRSGAPEAYAPWAAMARALAIATTGEVPAGLTCQFSLAKSKVRPASPLAALTSAFGPATLDAPTSAARGWTIVSWLVSHAQHYRITSVTFAGRQWSPHGKWSTIATNVRAVRIVQTPPA